MLIDAAEGDIASTTHAYERPALPNTGKAIRLEALLIFYYENAFMTAPVKYDSTAMLMWYDHIRAMDVSCKKGRAQIYNPHNCEPSWPNLLECLPRCHERALRITASDKGGVEEYASSKVAGTALRHGRIVEHEDEPTCAAMECDQERR